MYTNPSVTDKTASAWHGLKTMANLFYWLVILGLSVFYKPGFGSKRANVVLIGTTTWPSFKRGPGAKGIHSFGVKHAVMILAWD